MNEAQVRLENSLNAYLAVVMDFLEKNLKKPDNETSIEYYYFLAIVIGWGTFYMNYKWLLSNYNNKDVLFWQIQMTKRLLYETVSDTNYILKKKKVDKSLRNFFSFIFKDFTNEEVLNEYRKEIEQIHCNSNQNIGGSTTERIKECFDGIGTVNYNILCQFSHMNVAGFSVGYAESISPSNYRKTSLVAMCTLLNDMVDSISVFDGLENLKKCVETFKKNANENTMEYMKEFANE